MNRIIIDVTQLVHWTGRITGIPRVMQELAVRFDELAKGAGGGDGQEIIFVSWVKERQTLCPIDFGRTMTRAEGIIYSQSPATKSLASSSQRTSLPTPSLGLKLKARKVAKHAVKKLEAISPQLSRRIRHQAHELELQRYAELNIHKGDILFIPWGEWWDVNFTDYLVQCQASGVKLVQLIHDIGTTTQPQFFEQVAVNPASYNARILPIASLVLVNSENTKRETLQWLKGLKLHRPPMEVFRLGDDLAQVSKAVKPSAPEYRETSLRGGDFLLTVGTIEAKKNHMLLYYVYKLAKSRGIRLPKLLIVGRLGWHTEHVYDLIRLDPEVKDDIIFLLDTSDQELLWLYEHCLFTVQPSFHEGWGIPIAESMARGVPCLASNTSSMVEIAEGIVEHFSPASSDECLSAIQRMLEPAHYKVLKKRTATYKPHTWDDSFRQVYQHIKEL